LYFKGRFNFELPAGVKSGEKVILVSLAEIEGYDLEVIFNAHGQGRFFKFIAWKRLADH
jgi:hypothetical protein